MDLELPDPKRCLFRGRGGKVPRHVANVTQASSILVVRSAHVGGSWVGNLADQDLGSCSGARAETRELWRTALGAERAANSLRVSSKLTYASMPKSARTADTGDSVVLEDKVKFTCPFCQKGGSAGDDSAGVPYVLHEDPGCEKFIALEPDQYLRAVREFYQGN